MTLKTKSLDLKVRFSNKESNENHLNGNEEKLIIRNLTPFGINKRDETICLSNKKISKISALAFLNFDQLRILGN